MEDLRGYGLVSQDLPSSVHTKLWDIIWGLSTLATAIWDSDKGDLGMQAIMSEWVSCSG
jgi:hypothetical protein